MVDLPRNAYRWRRWRIRWIRQLTQLAAPANQQRLVWAVRVRWLVIVGFFLLATAAWLGGVMQRLVPCVLAASAAALLNLVNFWSVTRLRYVLAVSAAAIVGDVLLITALVCVTGGVSSPFVMMYVVQVVATAMLVGFVPALISAGLSGVSCGAAAWVLPPDLAAGLLDIALPPITALSYQLAWVGFLLYCLTLLAFLGGYIADRLRRSERDLTHSNARMRRALGSLRKAHTDLAATYARLRSTEAQLVHDEKMRALGLFVAGIAHELNNPIAVVAGNIDHLSERLAPLQPVLADHATRLRTDADRQDGVRRRAAQRLVTFVEELPGLLYDCLEGMRRAGEIVKSLHAFSRSGAGDAFQPVDLNAMLDRTLTLIRHRIGKSVVVERAYGDLPLVDCLPSQLDQVFLNLILNAVDAVGEAGVIQVTTATAIESTTGDARVTVGVTDSGSGIAPEALPHIFEPFFTTKPVGKGAGLGLSVSYGIVARHDGTLSVLSSDASGTTFVVAIPATRTADGARCAV